MHSSQQRLHSEQSVNAIQCISTTESDSAVMVTYPQEPLRYSVVRDERERGGGWANNQRRSIT